jgi:hypothetical protein
MTTPMIILALAAAVAFWCFWLGEVGVIDVPDDVECDGVGKVIEEREWETPKNGEDSSGVKVRGQAGWN